MDKSAIHSNICKELNNIYIEKNRRYGDSFSKTYDELGIISAVTQLTHKMNRITQLVTMKDDGGNESLRDNLLDLANYAIMTIQELDKEK